MKTIICVGALLMLSPILFAQELKPGKERVLGMFIEINAPIDSVWSRFATASGRAKFFAPSSRMEFSTLGYMEILFNPAAPEGQRGAENNRVLAFQEKEMISFTWDAPPNFSAIRKQRTVVVFRFYKVDGSKTLVTFHQMGWGTGAEWDAVYNYFSTAWSTFVLPNLKYSLEVGPLNWKDFPNNLPKGLKAATILSE
jgi:uncharacterized protein YndB with AHSA1/START domain